MNKNIIIVIVVLCLAAAGIAYYFGFATKKSSIAKTDFGYETILLIDQGKNTLACQDAKNLIAMIGDINEEIKSNPELANNVDRDNFTTPSLKKYQSSIDNFVKAIDAKYKDKEQKDKVQEEIGKSAADVFQVAMMFQLGMLQQVDLNDFVDVTYCGVPAKEGYVSPLEMLNNVTNMMEQNAPMDNNSKPLDAPVDNMSNPKTAPATK